MKKILKTIALTGMMLGLAATAQAVDTVQVTLTSPAIVKTGCEQVGAVTFNFDQGTVLTAGDWFYMDLPSGTSICTTIDYMISYAGNTGVVTDTVTYPGATNSLVTVAGSAATLPAAPAGASSGPIANVIENGTGAAFVVGGTGIVLRVYAPANGQRVWVYVYGLAAGDSLTIPNVATNNSSMDLTILDGQAYNGAALTIGVTLDTDQDGTYGESTTDDIGLVAGVGTGAVVPFAENTLCVNAEQMSGSLMFTSFNSLNSFLTFTGDSQLAHVASANALTLTNCKGDTTGNILLGGQNACSFNYGTAAGYCTGGIATFAGNRFFIQGATTFGDPGDLYDMTVTSDTAGVYFSAAPTLQGFTPAATNECTGAGAAIAAAFVTTNEAGTVGAAYDPSASCSVASVNRIRSVSTGNIGAISGIDTYDAMYVVLPTMVYDTSVVGNGTESKVTFKLNKYPCGQIFSQQATIGTFVTTCPAAAAGSILLYPFMPAMDGSVPGWWGGFTIINGSTASGTCTLAFQEEDDDTATYTTSTISAGGTWNAGALSDLLTNVTPGAANTGTFGDSSVATVATCTFSLGGGFAFTGNGTEGVGYTAYVQSAGAWQ